MRLLLGRIARLGALFAWPLLALLLATLPGLILPGLSWARGRELVVGAVFSRVLLVRLRAIRFLTRPVSRLLVSGLSGHGLSGPGAVGCSSLFGTFDLSL